MRQKSGLGFVNSKAVLNFSASLRCDQLYRAFDLLARPHVLQGDDLALIQRGRPFPPGRHAHSR